MMRQVDPNHYEMFFVSKRLNASWWKILPSHFSQVLNGVCLKGDPEDPSEQTWLTVFLTNISNVVQFRRWKCLASLSIISILFLLSSPSTCDLSFLYICTPSRFSFLSKKKIPWEEDLPIHHPQPTDKTLRGKVQGTWSQHQQQQVQDLSKAISDHTKYRTEELTPFAPRRRSFDDVPPGEWRTG